MAVFDELMSVNVNGHTEKKKTGGNELTYLSWPFAWAEVKKRYPDAHYEIEKFNGLPYVYDERTGYMVYTTVTIEGISHEMWLPVMDGANKAMKAEPYTYTVKDNAFQYCKKAEDGKYYDRYGKEHTEFVIKTVDAATMFDINKTVMRCLVKNLAMFGLGLYIYAGEDLPITDEPQEAPQESPSDAVGGISRASTGEGDSLITPKQKAALMGEMNRTGQTSEKLLAHYGKASLDDLTKWQASDAISKLKACKGKAS